MAIGPNSPVDPADRFMRELRELARAVGDLQRLGARAVRLPMYVSAAARDADIPNPSVGELVLVGSSLTVFNALGVWVVV